MVPLALATAQTLPAAAPEPGSALSAVAPCAAGPGVDGEGAAVTVTVPLGGGEGTCFPSSLRA